MLQPQLPLPLLPLSSRNIQGTWQCQLERPAKRDPGDRKEWWLLELTEHFPGDNFHMKTHSSLLPGPHTSPWSPRKRAPFTKCQMRKSTENGGGWRQVALVLSLKVNFQDSSRKSQSCASALVWPRQPAQEQMLLDSPSCQIICAQPSKYKNKIHCFHRLCNYSLPSLSYKFGVDLCVWRKSAVLRGDIAKHSLGVR